LKPRVTAGAGWVLAVVLTVFAIAPLSYPGFFQAQSGFLPPLNARHLADAPNWARVPDLVRGEGKLPYLLASPFLRLTGSGSASVKWGYGLAFVLGALAVYLWTRPWLGTRGGILASVVYTYLPWHLATVYVRGAYAEAWLWALWPFVLWAVDRSIRSRSIAAALLGLLALAASFWSQPGLTGLFLPLLVAYVVLVVARHLVPPSWRAVALALSLLAVWLAARALPESRVAFAQHFLWPFQLFSAAWGSAGSSGTASEAGTGWLPAPALSFQLGLAAVGLSAVALALLVRDRALVEPALKRAWAFWAAALLVVLVLICPVSAFVWQVSTLDQLLTYPWQLLALAGLPLAFLAGSVVCLEGQLARPAPWAALIAFAVLASYPYLAPRFTQVDPEPEPLALFQPLEAEAPQWMLLQAQIEPPTEITPTLTLTMTWQALAPVAGDYTVFVHVLGDGEAKVGQRDVRPCEGECPTSTWQPGDIVVDRLQVPLDPAASPAPYRLATGMYGLETGERVAVVGRQDGTVILDVP
jgi:hypothetical protein